MQILKDKISKNLQLLLLKVLNSMTQVRRYFYS